MNSFILREAGKLIFPVLLVLSLVILYRGHHLPGGGFIGGLLGASAFILVGLGESMEYARRRLRVAPVTLLAGGLALAVLSGLPGVFAGTGFMVGMWLPEFSLFGLTKVHLGTPLLFDVGVFFTVIGFTLETVFNLARLADPDETGEIPDPESAQNGSNDDQ